MTCTAHAAAVLAPCLLVADEPVELAIIIIIIIIFKIQGLEIDPTFIKAFIDAVKKEGASFFSRGLFCARGRHRRFYFVTCGR
jgi:hypothetical protein